MCEGDSQAQNPGTVDDILVSQIAAIDGVETPRQVANLSRAQRNGYLGRMSERAILSGNLELMTADSSYVDALEDQQSLKGHINLWHRVAIDSVALDHTPDPDIEDYSPSQGGPTRTSRALAMVQVTVFDALNSIEQRYQPYSGLFENSADASRHAAVAYAAHNQLLHCIRNSNSA